MARWTLSPDDLEAKSIGINYDTFRPSDEKILERYMLKFSKGGKAINLHEDDLGLLHPDGVGMTAPRFRFWRQQIRRRLAHPDRLIKSHTGKGRERATR